MSSDNSNDIHMTKEELVEVALASFRAWYLEQFRSTVGFCQCDEPDNDMPPNGDHCLNCGKVIRAGGENEGKEEG